MRSPLLDFGRQYAQRLLWLRLFVAVVALLTALILPFWLTIHPPALPLLFFWMEIPLSLTIILLRPRLSLPILAQFALVSDTVLMTVLVLAVGGNARDLALVFAWLVLTALMVLGIAAKNAQESKQVQQQVLDSQLLYDTQQAVSSTLELRQILSRFLEQLVTSFNLTSAYFVSLDEGGKTVTIRQEFAGQEANSQERLVETRTYLLTEFPGVQKALAAGASISTWGDPALTPEERELMGKRDCQTALCVPLRTDDATIGFLSLWETRLPRLWSAREIALVEKIAGQATLALSHAYLFADARQSTHKLEALYEASQQLNATLSIAEICQSGVTALSDVLGYDHVGIYFRKENTLQLECQRGYEDNLETIPLANGIMSRAIRTGSIMWLSDAKADPDFITAVQDIQSEIAVPLIHGSEVFGVLNVETRVPRRLTSADVRLVSIFANQLVIALDNARLHDQTRRDAEVKAALLRELSHRVKNNLAAITSLLHLALLEPAETREELLQETLVRAQSMVVAHALLARSSTAHVNALELGQQILHDAMYQLAPPGYKMSVTVKGVSVDIAPRQLTTVALVLNELATNSITHGLLPSAAKEARMQSEGWLELRVERRGTAARLTVSDNGQGLPKDFSLSQNPGTGLELVRDLVQKDLKGTLDLIRADGCTLATVEFEPEE